MTQSTPTASALLSDLLNEPRLARTRRNHGLEHATIHILTGRFPKNLAGHSTASGFRLVGQVETEAVVEAVEEALRRLRSGESQLSIHPFCGTNFVAAGTLAGLFAGVSMLLTERRSVSLLDRLALAMSGATLAIMLGFPLGMKLQARLTTSADMQHLRVLEVQRMDYGQTTVHYIRTES